MSDWRPPPPPDAGASYMGTYGIRNPWTIWLLRRAPELVAETPTKLIDRTEESPPPCPQCGEPMLRRAGGLHWEWRCYGHDEWVTVACKLRLPRAPVLDVLSRVKEALDIVYDDLENPGHPEWRVKELEL